VTIVTVSIALKTLKDNAFAFITKCMPISLYRES